METTHRGLKQSSPKSVFECDAENKNGIHTLLFYITQKCNCLCSHCYMGERLQQGSEFSFKHFTNSARYFRSTGAKCIVFLGGEPTLYPLLPEAVDEAVNIGFEMIRIFTNGRFSPDLLNKLNPKDVELLLFSLDGSNPEIDGLLRGRDNFHIALKTIKEALKKGFRVSITSTIHRHNSKDLKNILSVAEDLGIEMVNFNIFSQNGNGRNKPDWELSPKEWILFCDTLEQCAENSNLNFRYPPFYVTPRKLKQFHQEGYTGCAGKLKDRISIFPDNSLYICPLFYDSNLGFARLKGNTTALNPKRNELDFFNENHNIACLKCSLYPYCKGGCPAIRTISNRYTCDGWIKGDKAAFVPICMFWRRLIKR